MRVPVVALLSASRLGVTAVTDEQPGSPPRPRRAEDRSLCRTRFVKPDDLAEGRRHPMELVLKVTNVGDLTENGVAAHVRIDLGLTGGEAPVEHNALAREGT
ncbi:hypothetical protein HerbRD11066_60730 [Herbidospora sp. RD11066]